MKDQFFRAARVALKLFSALATAVIFMLFTILFVQRTHDSVIAAPIDPPQGYPKFNMSSMVVNPTLAHVGGETLQYTIEIVNTGAYTGNAVTLTSLVPHNTTYNGDAHASVLPEPVVANGELSWVGDVGFDSTVQITFTVNVSTTFSGIITNTAVITQAQLSMPITLTAQTVVTDQPIFTIQKTSAPGIPGPNKPLTYTLEVTNSGQPTGNLAVKVIDKLPANTTFKSAGPDGAHVGQTVTWNRNVNLDTGDSSKFTFTVNVGDVTSGTIITNQDYQVTSSQTVTATGAVYTSTILDPIFSIDKSTFPDPPGSNREMTYTLSVLNKGSLATNLVVTDTVPTGVTYVRGGTFKNGQVTWTLPRMDTGESAQFSYTVFIGDVANVDVVNSIYKVCSAEGACKNGDPFTSPVLEPFFTANVFVDPIAKKPGGGNSPVTPTLVLRNEGPGSAVDATVLMYFQRISVSFNDLRQTPVNGSFSTGPVCGDKCVSYRWIGDLAAGETITFTTLDGQNSIGGEQGNHYTATLVITDQLGAFVTQPYTATASGMVTHFANLIPTKTAPPVIGAGQVLTYSIEVFNSGLSTDVPPYPVLTETVPLSLTVLSASDGGVTSTVGGNTVISWTLPAMSTADKLFRTFSVQVGDLVSGTQIINQDYGTSWHDIEYTGTLSIAGPPITTTVREVGLIDSFKSVTPTLVNPGPGNVLTYTVHVVNSSPIPLTGVSLQDIFPWQHSTYLRDATASAGKIVSDIVSLAWNGDVAPCATELITFSVLVDDDFQGAITNTATISHTSLAAPVDVSAVAYVTEKPVFKISKADSPDPILAGRDLLYTIHVTNVGQQATNVIVTDTIPAHTTYVPGSATEGGMLTGGILQWYFVTLEPGETRVLSFKVKVSGGGKIVNDKYGVSSAEGVSLAGPPVTTEIRNRIYLPLIRR